MTADPRDPATWPSEPPKEDGWYFRAYAWPPNTGWRVEPEKIVTRQRGRLRLAAGLASGMTLERTPGCVRWYPTPITPANLRAEGEA